MNHTFVMTFGLLLIPKDCSVINKKLLLVSVLSFKKKYFWLVLNLLLGSALSYKNLHQGLSNFFVCLFVSSTHITCKQ